MKRREREEREEEEEGKQGERGTGGERMWQEGVIAEPIERVQWHLLRGWCNCQGESERERKRASHIHFSSRGIVNRMTATKLPQKFQFYLTSSTISDIINII